MSNFQQSALFEHRYWLQILRDHARFIRNMLPSKETAEIEKAQHFIAVFDQLLAKATPKITTENLTMLTKQAYDNAIKFRDFKLNLIKQQLLSKNSMGLPTGFLNNMVTEIDEYIRILSYLINQEKPPLSHPLHYHLISLLDAAGHANAISRGLGSEEKQLQEKSSNFSKNFDNFYIKAVELAGYLRTNLVTFPALTRFNTQVGLELAVYIAFLHELQSLIMEKHISSKLSPLTVDHIAREACYYLTKLAESAPEVKKPDCDPTKSQIEK